MWGFYPITVKREANGNDNESDGDNGDKDDGDHLLDGIWLGISDSTPTTRAKKKTYRTAQTSKTSALVANLVIKEIIWLGN